MPDLTYADASWPVFVLSPDIGTIYASLEALVIPLVFVCPTPSGSLHPGLRTGRVAWKADVYSLTRKQWKRSAEVHECVLLFIRRNEELEVAVMEAFG